MSSSPTSPASMTPYEQAVWTRLEDHWNRRAKRRTPPQWVSKAGGRLSDRASKAASAVEQRIPDRVRDTAAKAGGILGDKVLEPSIHAAVALLDLVNDWSAELTDPSRVVKAAQEKGLAVEAIEDLRRVDLKDCDRLLTRSTLSARTFGAMEGAGMGALALVPVAGLPVSLTADLVVIQAMSTAIASRIAYSYGFDAKDPAEEEFIRKLVNRSFLAQAAKAGPMHQVANAAAAVQGRKNWSRQLLENQRLLAALKKLMENAGPAAPKASVKNVGKTLPVIGVVLGAGTNSMVLGAVAKDAQRFCQTRFLCEKYGLPMPGVLAGGSIGANTEDEDDVAEDGKS